MERELDFGFQKEKKTSHDTALSAAQNALFFTRKTEKTRRERKKKKKKTISSDDV